MASESAPSDPPAPSEESAQSLAVAIQITGSCSAAAVGIKKSFSELVKDPERLDEAANYLYESLVDDAAMGIFLDVHRLWKTGKLFKLEEENQEEPPRMVDRPNFDIFGQSTTRKPSDCICPNCERSVATARFAPHLEKCMGMGRVSSRVASRRLASKESASTSAAASAYLQSAVASDDDDDVDWSAEKRRKKTSHSARSSKKK